MSRNAIFLIDLPLYKTGHWLLVKRCMLPSSSKFGALSIANNNGYSSWHLYRQTILVLPHECYPSHSVGFCFGRQHGYSPCTIMLLCSAIIIHRCWTITQYHRSANKHHRNVSKSVCFSRRQSLLRETDDTRGPGGRASYQDNRLCRTRSAIGLTGSQQATAEHAISALASMMAEDHIRMRLKSREARMRKTFFALLNFRCKWPFSVIIRRIWPRSFLPLANPRLSTVEKNGQDICPRI